jgi:predicted DNA-binding protein
MAQRRKPTDGAPVKTAVTLSGEASRRLRAGSLSESKTQSEMVQELILKHMPHYYVARRGGDEEN